MVQPSRWSLHLSAKTARTTAEHLEEVRLAVEWVETKTVVAVDDFVLGKQREQTNKGNIDTDREKEEI